jgi:uncharacterized protein
VSTFVLQSTNFNFIRKVPPSLEKLNFILPGTAEERHCFVLVAITAGVCEEILYRGFLIQYFRELPVHIGLTEALVLSACVSGLHICIRGSLGSYRRRFLGRFPGFYLWRRGVCFSRCFCTR